MVPTKTNQIIAISNLINIKFWSPHHCLLHGYMVCGIIAIYNLINIKSWSSPKTTWLVNGPHHCQSDYCHLQPN